MFNLYAKLERCDLHEKTRAINGLLSASDDDIDF